jgi:16S rRNA (guanine966-N2)-methyltransferase
MRVIAGHLGGRRIRAPRGRATRPTAEAVREALFSMLGDISGAEVLDLFAGTGALGIEALSRGARRAVFVERNAGSHAALQANLASLELGRGVALVRRAGAREGMRTARRRGETYDLVFIDPPYRQAQDWAAVLRDSLPPLLKGAARVVVESDRRAPLVLELPVAQERRYGDTLITIHRQA